jgi:lipopolysaccharide biosynthesis protein
LDEKKMMKLMLIPQILLYIDPGTGSIILQALVATIVGASLAVKLFWQRIKIKVFLPFSRLLSSCITKTWWNLPLSRQNKETLKSFVFSAFPFFFYRSKVYRNWKDAKYNSAINIGEKRSVNNQDVSFIINAAIQDMPESGTESVSNEQVCSVAIVLHAFYYEIFLEIMDYLKQIKSVDFSVYVTSPHDLSEKMIRFFESASYKYRFLLVENHGRDILPFFKIIPLAFQDGHQLILKIHTKKSDHRLTGDLWRKDIFKNLLTEKAMQNAISLFNSDKSIGLMGATGHIVPMSLYYGANARSLELLSQCMGVTSSLITNLNFAAGSMFYARKQALMPLLNLGLKSEDFEEEKGQNDGTLAHAVERAFAVSTRAAGLKLVDNSYEPQNPFPNITKDHPFTH